MLLFLQMSELIRKVQVLPYRFLAVNPEYLLLQRPPHFGSLWQPITGHVESQESELNAAIRELSEEIGVNPTHSSILDLDMSFSFSKRGLDYIEQVYAVNVAQDSIRLSKEHICYKWLSYADAKNHLPYATNRKALTKLNSLLLQKI